MKTYESVRQAILDMPMPMKWMLVNKILRSLDNNATRMPFTMMQILMWLNQRVWDRTRISIQLAIESMNRTGEMITYEYRGGPAAVKARVIRILRSNMPTWRKKLFIHKTLTHPQNVMIETKGMVRVRAWEANCLTYAQEIAKIRCPKMRRKIKARLSRGLMGQKCNGMEHVIEETFGRNVEIMRQVRRLSRPQP